jgi:hypothetical protein
VRRRARQSRPFYCPIEVDTASFSGSTSQSLCNLVSLELWYLHLPFVLSSWSVCAQTVDIEIQRSEIRIAVSETARLVSASRCKQAPKTNETPAETEDHRFNWFFYLRVSALGTKNKTTPLSAARVATSTCSSFSFFNVTVRDAKESPMSIFPSLTMSLASPSPSAGVASLLVASSSGLA